MEKEELRVFQKLDILNQLDIENNTANVAVSNIFVEGKTVKQGAVITMGLERKYLADVSVGNAIAILCIVNKSEFDKLK